jgi:hypothetical protein
VPEILNQTFWRVAICCYSVLNEITFVLIWGETVLFTYYSPSLSGVLSSVALTVGLRTGWLTWVSASIVLCNLCSRQI